MESVEYGKVEGTKVIDSQGSTATRVVNKHEGKAITPIRVKYEIRKRVKDQAEELEEYYKFSKEILEDKKNHLDPSFKIEGSRVGDNSGFYYVVRCFTRLEY